MNMKFFFTGDVVISRYREAPLLKPALRELISDADIVCCNFEAPITTNVQVKSKKVGPSIAQEKQTVDLLVKDGFNLFSLANNHIMDFGDKGLSATIDYIDEKRIPHVGAGMQADAAYAPYIFEKDGEKVAFLSVAENGFGTSLQASKAGYAWFGSELFDIQLSKALDECKYTFVICHGGAEKWDLPLPEYRKLYRSWIDAGVTGVIAHHPHVPQGLEIYKGKGIYYSLGNFAFDKGLGIQDPKTICAVINIKDGIVSFDTVYTKFTEQGVELCRDEDFAEHMKCCNDWLEEPVYMQKINKLCQDAYQTKYQRYYASVLNMYQGGIKQLVKTIIYRIVRRERFSDVWLYHNLAIETHYWIVRRAIDMRINHPQDKR